MKRSDRSNKSSIRACAEAQNNPQNTKAAPESCLPVHNRKQIVLLIKYQLNKYNHYLTWSTINNAGINIINIITSTTPQIIRYDIVQTTLFAY